MLMQYCAGVFLGLTLLKGSSSAVNHDSHVPGLCRLMAQCVVLQCKRTINCPLQTCRYRVLCVLCRYGFVGIAAVELSFINWTLVVMWDQFAV